MQEIERYYLEFPPGLARITKLGRVYNFSRTYRDDSPPEVYTGLRKAAAYEMLIDTLAIDSLEQEQ